MTPDDELRLTRGIIAEYRRDDPFWDSRENRDIILLHALALVRGKQWRCIRLPVGKWPPRSR